MSSPKIGEEGGLDFVVAGALGALMAVGDEALLLTLQAFAVSLGHDHDQAYRYAELWLPGYRRFLKSEGVANC